MSDEANDIHLTLVFGADHGPGQYQIVKGDGYREDEVVLWSRPYAEGEDTGEYFFPPDVRAKYEELLGKPEFDDKWAGGSAANLVEFFAEDQGFNQPCAFGNLCEGHAVYCHNDGWLYAPRKCRRTWYTGGEVRDEDCPGFKPNPSQKDALGGAVK